MKLTDKQQDEKRIAWATGKPAPEVIEEGAKVKKMKKTLRKQQKEPKKLWNSHLDSIDAIRKTVLDFGKSIGQNDVFPSLSRVHDEFEDKAEVYHKWLNKFMDQVATIITIGRDDLDETLVEKVVAEQESIREASNESKFQLAKLDDADRNLSAGLRALQKMFKDKPYGIEYPNGYGTILKQLKGSVNRIAGIHSSMEKLASRFDK